MWENSMTGTWARAWLSSGPTGPKHTGKKENIIVFQDEKR